MYFYLVLNANIDEHIDIRTESATDFVAKHSGEVLDAAAVAEIAERSGATAGGMKGKFKAFSFGLSEAAATIGFGDVDLSNRRIPALGGDPLLCVGGRQALPAD